MKSIVLCLILFFQLAYAQLNFTSGLTLNYGSGSTYLSENDSDHSKELFDFSQVLYDVNFYSGKWSLNSKIEFSNPPEIGANFKGLKRFLIKYNNQKNQFSFGDIYESWAKGLALNQYDDISLGFDNGIQGAAIALNNDVTLIKLLLGNKKIRRFKSSENFSRTPTDISYHSLIATYYKKKFLNFDLGFTSLINKEKFAINSFSDDSSYATHNIQSIFGNYISDKLELSFEFAQKYTSLQPALLDIYFDIETFTSDTLVRENNFGQGFALSSNYSLGNFHFSFDYSLYAFFVSDPLTQTLEPYPERVSQFQKPMVVSQEHSSQLLGRLNYQQNKNDEVGFNFNVNYSLGDNSSIAFNSSSTSRTKEWFRAKDSSSIISGPWEVQKKNYFFPSNDPSSTPYNQNTMMFESFLKNGYLKIILSDIEKINYVFENDRSLFGDTKRYEIEKALTIPISFQYNIYEDYNLILDLSYQNIKKGVQTNSFEISEFISYYENDKGGVEKSQNTFALSLGFSKSSKLSFQINIEKDDYFEVGTIRNNIFMNPLEKFLEPILKEYDKTWVSSKITYRFDDNYLLSIFYGSNKGGISCANGICRYYPGFSDGFRIQLTKSFY